LQDLADYLKQQARALAPERSRLLRRAQVGVRKRVLDLGCGAGSVTAELAERCAGRVIALDRNLELLGLVDGAVPRVAADALRLPWPADSFDLVFCQMLLLWVRDLSSLFAEARRILEPGGVLVIAAEPDYGGAIEFPDGAALAPLWVAGLERAGADPRVARRLPALGRAAGFEVEARFHPGPPAPAQLASVLDFEVQHLRQLPLNESERVELEHRAAARRAAGANLFAWVPTLGMLCHASSRS
jgi:SAM-dependent methyltransferase